MKVYLRL